jgi:hypothetical protein
VNDASKLIKKEKNINNGLSKYMEFWKLGMCKDESYVGKLGSYVNYRENILELLSNPSPTQG